MLDFSFLLGQAVVRTMQITAIYQTFDTVSYFQSDVKPVWEAQIPPQLPSGRNKTNMAAKNTTPVEAIRRI